MLVNRALPIVAAIVLVLATACHLKDPLAGKAPNNGANNGTTNGSNNQTAQNNGADAGSTDVGATDGGGVDAATNGAPSLPSSASPTGGTYRGSSPNYQIRLQVGAPHASPDPATANHSAKVGPPMTP